MSTVESSAQSYCDDELRVVIWNIQHNGRNGEWEKGMEILSGFRPHLVLRQELPQVKSPGKQKLTNTESAAEQAVAEEARKLGKNSGEPFIPFVAKATPESPNATGVFIDPRMFTVEAYYEHTTSIWHPISNPKVKLKGSDIEISVASFHLCSWNPPQRQVEARRLAFLARPGMNALVGGDCNSYCHLPETTPPPEWSSIADRSHYEFRTVERNGERITDVVPDEILSAEVNGKVLFHELGRYAAMELPNQPDALTPTASLQRRDQGHPQRIDRMYATPAVARSLTSLRTVVTDDIRYVSDHAPVVATFSLATLKREAFV